MSRIHHTHWDVEQQELLVNRLTRTVPVRGEPCPTNRTELSDVKISVACLICISIEKITASENVSPRS